MLLHLSKVIACLRAAYRPVQHAPKEPPGHRNANERHSSQDSHQDSDFPVCHPGPLTTDAVFLPGLGLGGLRHVAFYRH
eukprot:scaffold201254_cov37-Prasinocladus_malaysianus.AAC.1